jgi:hypothetical protein
VHIFLFFAHFLLQHRQLLALPIKIAPRFYVFTHSPNLTCFEESGRHLHAGRSHSESSVARPNFFVHTVAHKNWKIYQVPTYRQFKLCTARFQVHSIKQSFEITLFCRNTILLMLWRHSQKWGSEKVSHFLKSEKNGSWEVTR